jgi:hypothetical protein
MAKAATMKRIITTEGPGAAPLIKACSGNLSIYSNLIFKGVLKI